jgi:UPF0716 protein FxsA
MLLLPLLLLAWPIAEVFVAIKVAEAIGVLETLALLIVGWPLGTWAVRSQGRAVWRRLAAAVAEGRAPAREVLDGALVLIGGALLIVPGFITDALGIVFLLPPTRALMRVLLIRNLQSRVVVRAARYTRRRDPGDVEGTATDIDQPKLRA